MKTCGRTWLPRALKRNLHRHACRQVLRPGHYTPSSAPLLCAQESIKSSQQWFIACGPSHAPALVALLARRLMALPSYDKQLHVVYLANDILFKALQGRQTPGSPAAQDPVASAFLPALGPMLAAAYQRGGRTEEVRPRGREGGGGAPKQPPIPFVHAKGRSATIPSLSSPPPPTLPLPPSHPRCAPN